MTSDEKVLAVALAKCTFVPGIPTKRFARDMADRASVAPDLMLTRKQRKYLCEAVIKFRRQIPQSVVSLAEKMLAHPAMQCLHEWESRCQRDRAGEIVHDWERCVHCGEER